MRFIEKRREPTTITETRCASTTHLETSANARTAYDQIDKQAVRDQLVREQGWLCAFCMARISDHDRDDHGEPTMKIAHRTPIDADPKRALDWNNLLGCCDGGQRSRGPETCDLAQKSNPLSIDPTKKTSVSTLRYEVEGTKSGLLLRSDNPAFAEDIETLGLNRGDLPNLRQSAWKAFQQLCARDQRQLRGKPAWKHYFPKWLADKNGKRGELPPFVGVIKAKLA